MNSTGEVILIGAGPGDPELLTLKAIRALERATVWLVDDLVSAEIVALAAPSTRVVYVGKRGGCRSTPQAFILRLMARYARQGQVVARLKGGDPFVFGRGGEEWAWLAERGVKVSAVAGLTAGLAAGAAAGIPLTHRGQSRGVALVTAHTMDGSRPDWYALARSGLTVVCYMGMQDPQRLSDELIAAGFRPDLPVKVVMRVACLSQREARTCLQSLAQTIAQEGLSSPAVVILGEVAAVQLTASALATVVGF